MLLRVGEFTAKDPRTGDPVLFKVIQAFDPVFEIPVAQISAPKGEISRKLGLSFADKMEMTESGLIVPDVIPPDEMRPGEQ